MNATSGNDTERRTYDMVEGAAMLGVSRGHIYQMARAGEIPGVLSVGRRLLISRQVFDAWIAGDAA
jgi:excisionase family DNA binding protein